MKFNSQEFLTGLKISGDFVAKCVYGQGFVCCAVTFPESSFFWSLPLRASLLCYLYRLDKDFGRNLYGQLHLGAP